MNKTLFHFFLNCKKTNNAGIDHSLNESNKRETKATQSDDNVHYIITIETIYGHQTFKLTYSIGVCTGFITWNDASSSWATVGFFCI